MSQSDKKECCVSLEEKCIIPSENIRETENCVEVAKKLLKNRERRIFVVNSENFPVGVISLVDINDRLVALNRNVKKTKAREIMSRPIKLVVSEGEQIKDIKRKMKERKSSFCPVVGKKGMIGVINSHCLKYC